MGHLYAARTSCLGSNSCVSKLTLSAKYFTKYKQRSLDSFEFKAEVSSFFTPDATASDALKTIDWDTWFYKPGYPPSLDLDTSLSDACDALSTKWENLAKGSTDWTPSPSDVADLSANQVVVFLSNLIESDTVLSAAQIEDMGHAYGFLAPAVEVKDAAAATTVTRNIEVLARYFTLGLSKSQTRSLLAPTAEVLSRVGRIKFVRKLYASMMATDAEFARRTFEANKAFYHPICRGLVEKVVLDENYRGMTD